MLRLAVTGLLAAFVAAPVAAQAPPSFRGVDPVALPLDRPGVWTFHFAYRPPRITTVNVPGGGKKLVWYMVYQVWNTSDTPQTLVPLLELVTKDGPLQSFLDEPQPTVLEQIKKLEDPTGDYKIKSSVQMSAEKIPVTKQDAVPRAVTGVAVWLAAPEKAATANNFSVYVTGLSNSRTVAQAADGTETVKRKTLQIDFVKPTDATTTPRLDDIKPSDNNGLGAEKWMYRVTAAKRGE